MNRLLTRIWLSLLLIVGIGLCATDAVLASRGHEFGFAVGWGVQDGKPELETCTTGCKSGIAGSGKGQLSVPVGVAVNEASGDFYVLDQANGRVERFNAKGDYLGEFDGSGVYEAEGKLEASGEPPTGPLLKPTTIAIDNSCVQRKLSESQCKELDPSAGDVYITGCGLPEACEPERDHHDVVDKFTATGNYIGQVQIPVAGHFLELMGVAVDSHGNLWLAEDQGLNHRAFDEFTDGLANEHSQFVEDEHARFKSENSGLAVDANDDFYVIVPFESPFEEVAAAFSPLGKALGAVSRVQSRGVAAEWKSGNVYVDAVHTVERFTADITPIKLEEFGAGSMVDGRGIAAESVVVSGIPEREGPVYAADAGAADVLVFPLERPKTPTIEGVSASSVTSESTTLRAVVNPRGARTEYLFEYGLCRSGACGSSSFEASVPGHGEGLVGEPLDFEGHEVSVHLQGLEAGTTYHFRVSARNEKNASGEFVQSAEVAFRTQPRMPVERLLDRRDWEMVSPPHKHGTLIQHIFEADVIQAATGGHAFTFVTDTPTEDQPHGSSNFVQVLARRTSSGWVSEDLALPHLRATGLAIGQGQEYRFFSEDLSIGLVQPFGAFDPEISPEATEQTPYSRTNFVSGDPEMSCTTGCYTPFVSANDAKEGAHFGEEGSCPPRVMCGPVAVGASPDGQHVIVESSVGLTGIAEDKGGLYEWSNGTLSLISVLPGPGGKPAPPAISPLLGGGGVTRDAVSTDGSRVVWSASLGKSLYLRDVTKEETIEVNKGLPGTPEFQTANAAGSRIFFKDNGDLYVYEVEKGQAIRLTVPIEAGESTELLGKIAGVSEDGSYVYFVANGRLSKEAQRIEHSCAASEAAVNRCYLYVEQFTGGTWGAPRLVAVLSGGDGPDFEKLLPKSTARVSPNGRWVVFMSQLSLTGYDNRDAVSGMKDEEIFLYDSSNSKLVCVSCDPTGARPVGRESHQLEGGLAIGDRVWPRSIWLAANVPGWTPYALDSAFYQSRYLLDDGRVFFNSSGALVPQDVNGTEDVYEYEPEGVGSCEASSLSFVQASGGCIDLVSAGTSRQESAFLDASTSGSDVFFLTASRLVSADFDTALDVYDAHECMAAYPCFPEALSSAAECLTEASCKAAPSLQPEMFGEPASATFSGLGNFVGIPAAYTERSSIRSKILGEALSMCRRNHTRSKRRRLACERSARAKSAMKRSNGRRR